MKSADENSKPAMVGGAPYVCEARILIENAGKLPKDLDARGGGERQAGLVDTFARARAVYRFCTDQARSDKYLLKVLSPSLLKRPENKASIDGTVLGLPCSERPRCGSSARSKTMIDDDMGPNNPVPTHWRIAL